MAKSKLEITLPSEEVLIKLKNSISKIPYNGWWKSDTQNILEGFGLRMLIVGLSLTETMSIIEGMYYTIAAEYGE